MARRNLLHKSHLPEFKEFLNYNGINWREGRGDWQVLQIDMQDGTWQAIYENARKEHLSVPDPLVKITEIFYRERK